MARFYLMNGNSGKGSALNLLVNNSLWRSFNDISDIDLLTMKMNRDEASTILEKYNKDADLSGMFYILKNNDNTNSIDTYAPLFNSNNDEAKEMLERLEILALERSEKAKYGNSLALNKDRNFNDYVMSLLYKVLNTRIPRMTDGNSLVNYRIKNEIRDFYKAQEDANENNKEFDFRKKVYALYKRNENGLKYYSTLRELTIEYILYLEDYKNYLKSAIRSRETWQQNGLYDVNDVPYNVEEEKIEERNKELILTDFKQMNLTDLLN